MNNDLQAKAEIESYLTSMKGGESSYPFGPEALVFKVMGKMYGLVSEKDGEVIVTLKCQPEDGEVLTSQFESVSPGYYMNKKHWITISLNGDVSDAMLKDLAKSSYQLIVSKLKKSEKAELAAH
ncbi:hypothetical protein A3K86_03315 [Photobacterium jeanii]|uniref:MmcQ-like protein n=1 Tax=Photobacterium jeanii TaxID=858640 RepID=A0A178KL42_9GAMM|nr:MmcQ/YjbR family DNA-binding protein [Photobacterium jeanii]OAN17961.1 hypothetical protein A3K86_03315 [Photobacterium jeanii]PST92368.1 MmcQ/YjbR family DNA-binding protein [Photobacterium jeanii]